jgi:ATP-binding cassette, subfamily B, bacterial
MSSLLEGLVMVITREAPDAQRGAHGDHADACSSLATDPNHRTRSSGNRLHRVFRKNQFQHESYCLAQLLFSLDESARVGTLVVKMNANHARLVRGHDASPMSAKTMKFQPFLRPYRFGIAAIIGFEVASVALQLLLPWPMKVVVDHVLGQAPLPGALSGFSGLSPLGLAIAAALAGTVLSLAESLLTYGSSIATSRAGEFIGRDIRCAVMNRLLGLDREFREGFDPGELSSRLGTDVDRVQENALAIATTVLPDVALVFGMVAVLGAVDVRLTVLLVLLVPPLVALTILRRRLTHQAQARVRRTGGKLASTTIEQLQGVDLAQMFTREPLFRDHYVHVNDTAVAAALAGNRTQARFRPPTDLVLSLGATIIIVFGVTQIRSGRLSTGTLLVVLSYLGNIYGPVRRLVGISASSAKAAASAERLAELMCARPSIRQSPLRLETRFERELRFEDVEARYPNGHVALTDINLVIHPGESLCVVGQTGAGKSTLLSLIPRLIEPTAGAISVDGTHLGALCLESWRNLVAVVPQEDGLMNGTIAENIAFGRQGATEADVMAAATIALVDEFATRLHDGYDTLVGTDGSRLSGGQRRRIALARALVRQAPILLLDEPTTGLDGLSEQFVVESIRRAAVGRTCVMVTHRTDLALDFDRVVVLDGGRIVEVGRPDDLLASGGYFEALRAAQLASPLVELQQLERR